MKKHWFLLLSIITFTVLFSWSGMRIYKDYVFNINAGGHLKRAADANTIELAQKELDMSLKYIEENNLTKGYTSVLIKTPDEDLEFWYQNLKSTSNELKKIDVNATQLEKTNVLMKLRETLLDSGEKSVSVTVPSGISVFPNNMGYAIWGWLSLILTIGWFVGLCIKIEDI